LTKTRIKKPYFWETFYPENPEKKQPDMSDAVQHECGFALIRLLKPLEYYLNTYGTPLYGLDKLSLLMEKQHNRGQDGAGIANIKFGLEPGAKYINRLRSASNTPIIDIFNQIYRDIRRLRRECPEKLNDTLWLKQNIAFTGELYLGHLRYGTFGKNNIEYCHPFVRKNNWPTKNLVVAGNFNLTNVDELFQKLISYGQHPVDVSDMGTVLEKIGHFLDEENETLNSRYSGEGLSRKAIMEHIGGNLDLQRILQRSCKHWDGGYVIAGLIGHGDAFVLRDPWGIRPAYYYADEEVVVAASERPVIQTTFNVKIEDVRELQPGCALLVRQNGHVEETRCKEAGTRSSCAFERIYFSRGTDSDIYQERKKLGKYLAPAILRAVNHDFENTVFSYIPNTAAVAYYGLVEELQAFCNSVKTDNLLHAGSNPDRETISRILALAPRTEKIAVKDVTLRTFITQDRERDDLAAHVYDVTYGIVRSGIDSIVVLDDSIVRGTTLRQSILRMLDRLEPKMIVVASSAPQIRYPDCYGIDMAKLSEFAAFRAAIELLKETKQESIINQVYRKAKEQEKLPAGAVTNVVKEIYAPFSAGQISDKIAEMLTPPDIKAKVKIIFQAAEDLLAACPGHRGDWYFTGDYPTPGGNRVAVRSYINYIEGKNERAYS
jgi:amidophosphoribosyltransferase